MIEIICIGCGCTDDDPCIASGVEGTGAPCSWIRMDPLAGVGVCSTCPASDEARFDNGDRELSEEAEERRAELSAELEAELDSDPLIITPGDYDYEETVREMRRR